MNKDTKDLLTLTEDLLKQINDILEKDSDIIEDYEFIDTEIINMMKCLFNIFGKVKEYKVIKSGGEEEYQKEIEKRMNSVS